MMTETETTSKPTIVTIGPRVIAACRRRVHELESRQAGAITHAEHRELARLKEFLRLIATEGDSDG
jgi:hypothetical protein